MPNLKESKKRFFLVGCPRSGTTLLQMLLSAHSKIASFPESQFFLDAVGLYQRRVFGEMPSDFREAFYDIRGNLRVALGIAFRLSYQRVQKFLDDVNREDLIALFPRNHSLKQQTRAFFKILDVLTADQGKELWLEKSPHHLSYIDVIERYEPNANFIHLVRNGTDTIASIYAAMQTSRAWSKRYQDSLERYLELLLKRAIQLSYSTH